MGVGAGKGGREGAGRGQETGPYSRERETGLYSRGALKTQYMLKQDFFPVRVLSTNTNLTV